MISSALLRLASSRAVASSPARFALAIASPGLVALELQRLDAGQDLPARLIELGQRGEGRLEAGPPGEEALPGRLEVVAEESGVEHA